MADIRLKETRIEDEGEQRVAVFGLSEAPAPSWVVWFEECLWKHTGVAVVVFGRTARIDLQEPEREEFARLRALVERCIDEANVGTA